MKMKQSEINIQIEGYINDLKRLLRRDSVEEKVVQLNKIGEELTEEVESDYEN